MGKFLSKIHVPKKANTKVSNHEINSRITDRQISREDVKELPNDAKEEVDIVKGSKDAQYIERTIEISGNLLDTLQRKDPENSKLKDHIVESFKHHEETSSETKIPNDLQHMYRDLEIYVPSSSENEVIHNSRPQNPQDLLASSTVIFHRSTDYSVQSDSGQEEDEQESELSLDRNANPILKAQKRPTSTKSIDKKTNNNTDLFKFIKIEVKKNPVKSFEIYAANAPLPPKKPEQTASAETTSSGDSSESSSDSDSEEEVQPKATNAKPVSALRKTALAAIASRAAITPIAPSQSVIKAAPPPIVSQAVIKTAPPPIASQAIIKQAPPPIASQTVIKEPPPPVASKATITPRKSGASKPKGKPVAKPKPGAKGPIPTNGMGTITFGNSSSPPSKSRVKGKKGSKTTNSKIGVARKKSSKPSQNPGGANVAPSKSRMGANVAPSKSVMVAKVAPSSSMMQSNVAPSKSMMATNVAPSSSRMAANKPDASKAMIPSSSVVLKESSLSSADSEKEAQVSKKKSKPTKSTKSKTTKKSSASARSSRASTKEQRHNKRLRPIHSRGFYLTDPYTLNRALFENRNGNILRNNLKEYDELHPGCCCPKMPCQKPERCPEPYPHCCSRPCGPSSGCSPCCGMNGSNLADGCRISDPGPCAYESDGHCPCSCCPECCNMSVQTEESDEDLVHYAKAEAGYGKAKHSRRPAKCCPN